MPELVRHHGLNVVLTGGAARRPHPDVIKDYVVFLQSGEIGVLDSEGWDLLAPDAMARLRRPMVDLGWYRGWARSRTLAEAGPLRLAQGGG